MACKPPNFACIAAATAEKRAIGIENRLPWKLKRDMRYFEQVTKRVIINDHEDSRRKGDDDDYDSSRKEASATKKNAVLMGRRQWESIPPKYQPLKQRLNAVLSRTWKVLPPLPNNVDQQNNDSNTKDSSLAQNLPLSSPPVLLFNDFMTAIESLSANPQVSQIYVIGGSYVYAEAMASPLCTHILLTQIYKEFEADTFFPPIDESVYQRATHEELVKFVGEDVPEGVQEENEIRFEFLMYKRVKFDV
ncbi:13040_t:CDS:2 [Ambispora leptoticha]|uniref:Dihydrofolate reductase n=1 Tax=Ambispora leptoticha TaxID=144679 RepID=A0A9N9BFC8_9GLOM|nr:13040_t:CDS:2 [Ambispora leptoticha]